MFKPLKFTREQAKDIVFVSDLHIQQNQKFLLDGRQNFTSGSAPFSTGTQHDEWIYSEWEQNLSDKIVFNLGDQTFRDAKGEGFTRLSKLPCKAHYVTFGNHTSGMKQCYQRAVFQFLYPDEELPNDPNPPVEVYPVPYNNVTFVGNDLRLWVGKQEVHLSHFPKKIWDNMSEKRRVTETGGLKGPRPSLHLHGHNHHSMVSSQVHNTKGKVMDVGVEGAIIYDDKFWFTYDEVEQIMTKKHVRVLDHHTGTENPS